MKKIYSFALAAVAILSAASCQKELVNDENLLGGGNFTVTAVASADSKAVLDGVNTYWTPGDKIVVYDAAGAEATFSTDITEKAASAKFTSEAEFTAPESLVAVYPKRTDRGATSYADGVISGLHIGGSQTAVADSFDPLYAVSVGTPKTEGSTELVFNAAHCLVKFTVGGETAPTTVTLKNNGLRAIAGVFSYTLEDRTVTMTAGNLSIDLTGSFEVGKTYYIALTPGICGGGISLLYDGVEMKNTGSDITLEAGKIYNLGTLPAPAEESQVEKVSVAEFLAAAEDDTMYQLTGIITRMYQNTSNDSLYGNFYLKDETSEVLIYGLCSPEGAQQYWAQSGAKIGDTITIETTRTSYNSTPQGKNAKFVELIPFVPEASGVTLAGAFNEWNATATPFMTVWYSDDIVLAEGIEVTEGGFKVVNNGQWRGLAEGGKSIEADKYYVLDQTSDGENISLVTYGTYDVYFDKSKYCVAFMTPGTDYSTATEGTPVVVVEGLDEHSWGVVGSFQNWDPANAVEMAVEGDYVVAKNVTLVNGDEFKFAADGTWDLSYGSNCDVNIGETYTTFNNGGNMKFVGEAGAYNLYFSLIDASFYMEAYSAATEVVFDVSTYNFANQTALDEYTVEAITFAFDGGGNNNSPKYYTGGSAVRCYPKNTITISGATIKKVELVVPDDYTNAIDLYYGANKLDNFVWEGSSDEVVLTFDPDKTSGQSRFVAIKVTYE